MVKSEEILKQIDDYLANEEECKEKLSKDFTMKNLFKSWLTGYSIY